MIDHSLLHPNLTADDIRKGCREAIEHVFASVVVNPAHVPIVAAALQGLSVKVCSVIAFPFGLSTPEAKAYEARNVLAQGAEEIDMVINFSALRSKQTDFVLSEIKDVVRQAKASTKRGIVKVILENCYLSDAEKKEGCRLAMQAGADFVKTSTGFGRSGATVEDIRLMRSAVGPSFGVKAAGGIRTLDEALAMIEAGANRIGTSASVSIIEGYES